MSDPERALGRLGCGLLPVLSEGPSPGSASHGPLDEMHVEEPIPHQDVVAPAQPGGGPLHRPGGFGCLCDLSRAWETLVLRTRLGTAPLAPAAYRETLAL